jgi:hypothetical protein
MTVETSLARLRELALALPRPGCDWEERPRFDPPASAQSVAELEGIAEFAFPADFRAFLSHTNAVVGMSVHCGYWIGGVEQLLRSADRGEFPHMVDAEPVIPMATDGGGNAFLLGVSGCVWRWDHETGNVMQVAKSFNAFLEQVTADWAAYIADTPGWRFLV